MVKKVVKSELFEFLLKFCLQCFKSFASSSIYEYLCCLQIFLMLFSYHESNSGLAHEWKKMNTDYRKNIAKDHEGKKIASRLANQSSKAGFNLLLVTY